VEYARDTAEKFNRVFSADIFKIPEPLILENVKTVPGIDGQKMSKSYGNTIPLFAEKEEIKKLAMAIVTDSGSGVPTNVRAIHELFRDKKSLDALYEEKKGKYQALKEALIEDLEKFVAPLREKRTELSKNPEKVLEILSAGGKKASAIAEKKMEIVRKAVGVR
jgi:tryptophanyl-tRNA synthetase